MKTANLTIVPSFFFINGITASLMASKGIKHYSFDFICLSKTKIPTTVTSATIQFQGLGILWYNSFNALSGITLPNELRSKFSFLSFTTNCFSIREKENGILNLSSMRRNFNFMHNILNLSLKWSF